MLGLCTSPAGGMGSIPGWGTKILQAMQRGQKKKKKKNLKINFNINLVNMKSMKLQDTEWEKIFATHRTNKKLINGIYIECLSNYYI